MTAALKRRAAELDARLLNLAKPILVLKYLNWPDSIEEAFLEGWRTGRPALPNIGLRLPDWSKETAALDDFVKGCDGDDPIIQFLRRTAWSYAEAGRMLMAAGTPEFTERSIHLYGRPDDVYATQSFTGVDAAAFLLEKTEHLLCGAHIAPVDANLPADQFAVRLQQAISAYFVDDPVKVVVDNELSSKAIAGTTRLRVRGSAVFSDLDFDQLYHHEALVHMATAINGRRQTNLQSLGLGAPRTTRTQEGIAVFAELATRSIDINRLRRLALRIQALKQALDGADFIDCFKLFLQAGQDERESYKSAQRIFRGGNVRGRVVFTKDSAYVLAVCFLAFSLYGILRAIFAKSVSGDTLFGAVCGYLLLGIIWSLLYLAVETTSPGSFSVPAQAAADTANVQPSRGDLSYYSFITLTTVGYGDITPTTPLVRTLAWMEAVAGQFYLAVLVAGLVGYKVAQAARD